MHERTNKRANIRPLLNPQGDRPRSVRSLAINYQILPGQLDNTVRFSCLLSRSGDPWRGPSNWGLVTKDTQAHTHIPLALWYSGSLWMNPPYSFDGSRGGRHGVYGNGQQEIAHRGRSIY